MATVPPLVIALLVPLIIWRMYSRIRRLIGRQKSRLWRHWAAAIFFPLLLLLLAMAGFANPVALAGLAGGVAVGVGLAFYGFARTRFETGPAGYFYTPNAHIGIGLSLLFVARIGYRFYEIYVASGSGGAMDARDIGQSALTLVTIGMLGGYYAAYAMCLLGWRRKAAAAPAAAP